MQKRDYVVIGTSWMHGEDRYCKGYVHMFDLVDVVPEADRPETDYKLKHLLKEEMKGGPVSNVCTHDGYLLVTISAKLMLYSFEDGENLLGIAFLDQGVYTTTVRSIKSYIILGDLCHSLSFMAY